MNKLELRAWTRPELKTLSEWKAYAEGLEESLEEIGDAFQVYDRALQEIAHPKHARSGACDIAEEALTKVRGYTITG